MVTNYTLREINVRKVDQFIKKLSSAKSYSTAMRARTVLSLAFGLAVRNDALKENPVRGIAKMHRPLTETGPAVQSVRTGTARPARSLAAPRTRVGPAAEVW